jgi:serine/threonine-protein kinase
LADLNRQCDELRKVKPRPPARDIGRQQTPQGPLLGSGGNATVRLEFSPDIGENVAVKRIRAQCYDEARFRREITVMWKLEHPCIARIYARSFPRGSQEAEMHIEFAEHGSLQRVMEHANEAPEEFWNPTGKAIIICGIVLGMRFVHSKGYIHGDLKPSNILIKTGGRALISDFGTSRLASDDVKPTTDWGTVRYSAPEMLLPDGVCTTKADIFCLGLVLYEILTGSAVFPVSIPLLPFIGKLRSLELPVVPDSCGELMKDLIHRCWLREPESRPSCNDILDDFRKADFELGPEVDRFKVRQYVNDVLSSE